jgi:hypothetical protein
MAKNYGIGEPGKSTAPPKRKLIDRFLDAITPAPKNEPPAKKAPAKKPAPGTVGDVEGTMSAIEKRNKALRDAMK